MRDPVLCEQLISYGTAEAGRRPRQRRRPRHRPPHRHHAAAPLPGRTRLHARPDPVRQDRGRHPRPESPAAPPGLAVARGADLGPIGTDFGAVCDQIDQADALLADLRSRVINGQANPAPDPLDPASQTVTFILDAATANAAIHAITINAVD
jgi:hypothetical protein